MGCCVINKLKNLLLYTRLNKVKKKIGMNVIFSPFTQDIALRILYITSVETYIFLKISKLLFNNF